MTVLIVTGSPQGIVIAADSKRRTSIGEYETDKAQKVWRGETRDNRDLVFGWAGQAGIDREVTRFWFSRASLSVLKTMDLGTFEGFPEKFIAEFSDKMSTELQHFLKGYDPSNSAIVLSGPIAVVALGWFSNGKPVCASLRLGYEDGKIVTDCLFLEKDPDDFVSMIAGSPTLFAKGLPPINNLEDAVTVAENFTQDCIDNRNLLADCADYGGFVHSGKLSESGFSWAKNPPAAESEGCV